MPPPPLPTATRLTHTDSDSESSLGDDESDLGGALHDMHMDVDLENEILPEQFAGQEVVDLEYGAAEMFNMSGWGREEDADDDVSDCILLVGFVLFSA